MKKEIGMLFNGDMVRALLAGRKTQTRRILKEQPHESIDVHNWGYSALTPAGHVEMRGRFHAQEEKPYGSKFFKQKWWPGDLFYVRESFAFTQFIFDRTLIVGKGEVPVPDSIIFSADDPEHEWDGRYTPSIHMPKEAARIWFEVESVRVERVQNISEDDAWAEGCPVGEPTANGGYFPAWIPDPSGKGEVGFDDSTEWFQWLWENVYGAESWDANPWVWVITFKLLSTTGRPAHKS